MVFIGGPRQVGKTTVAKGMLENDNGYLHWDVPEQREKILKKELPEFLWVSMKYINTGYGGNF